MDRQMLTSQKNQIYELVTRHGLDPSCFEWQGYEVLEDADSVSFPMLVYRGTNFHFMFHTYGNGQREARYSPGRDQISVDRYTATWEGQLVEVGTWLNCLKREIAEPDLWEQLDAYELPADIEISADHRNTPFTYQEYMRISSGLDRIHDFIGEGLSDQEKLDKLQDTVDYLKEAAQRQGRRDWFFTCVGALMSTAVSLALDPEKSSGMWSILRGISSGIFRMLGH